MCLTSLYDNPGLLLLVLAVNHDSFLLIARKSYGDAGSSLASYRKFDPPRPAACTCPRHSSRRAQNGYRDLLVKELASQHTDSPSPPLLGACSGLGDS